MGPATLLERLMALAERQRRAAVAFDLPEIDATTRARADLLFELKVRLGRGLEGEEKERVRALLPSYRRAEERLAKVVGNVVRALQPPPVRVSTYGRRGALRGR